MLDLRFELQQSVRQEEAWRWWQQELSTVIERTTCWQEAVRPRFYWGSQPLPQFWYTGKHLQCQGTLKIIITLFTPYHPHVQTTTIEILALLDCISWVLHTDPCIARLHILCFTHRSLHCLIPYLGFYTHILPFLGYISWFLHTDPFIAWLKDIYRKL